MKLAMSTQLAGHHGSFQNPNLAILLIHVLGELRTDKSKLFFRNVLQKDSITPDKSFTSKWLHMQLWGRTGVSHQECLLQRGVWRLGGRQGSGNMGPKGGSGRWGPAWRGGRQPSQVSDCSILLKEAYNINTVSLGILPYLRWLRW